MEWTRYRQEDGLFYYKTEVFNDYKYHLEAYIDSTFKTEIFWFALSSGKKRKELDIYVDKENKSKGGIKALMWAKKEILDFPNFAGNPLKKRRYIGILWSDNRRRNIYSRLLKEGFQFQIINKQKVLIKKL